MEAIRVSSIESLMGARLSADSGTTSGAMPMAPTGVPSLVAMKKGLLEKDFDACLTAAPRARKEARTLLAWISVVELDCAIQNAVQNSAPSPAAQATNKSRSSKKNSKPAVSAANDAERAAVTEALAKAVQAAEHDKTWLLFGAQQTILRKKLVEAELLLLERDSRGNRTRAAETIDRLELMTEWMDERQKARLWRFAGEVAFLAQRLDEAREFINRSLALNDNGELRGKLAAIESGLLGKIATRPSPSPTPAQQAAPLEATAEEMQLVDSATSAFKSGEFVPAVDDAIKLIHGYPGSSRAKWAAERILEAFLSLAEKGDDRAVKAREKILAYMAKADADRMAEWARVIYNRGYYANALELSRRALAGMNDSARSTKTWLLAAEAAIHIESFADARDLYKVVVDKHSGTTAAREAMLRLGLVEYRMKNYPAAIADFERLLALSQLDTSQEVIARHWLWRSLQKTGATERAQAQAEILVSKFPFSYYGLRARAEAAGGNLDWPKEPIAKIEVKLWLTAREKQTWERIKILLAAGWLDEAQEEIQDLPAAVKPEEKALRARLWAAALNYQPALKLINEAWDSNAELRRPPFVAVAFPREYASLIESNANTRKIEPALVMSLIKQESAFFTKAQSSSQAMGLMQLIPPTAREMAVELKMGEFSVPDDLFNPVKNVRVGSYYLSKLLHKFQGHIPLALASYNAGPTKVERWLKARPGLNNLPQLRSSDPDDELWIDELPWDETSYYVKAILRNLLFYRVLEKGRVELKSPLWNYGGAN